MMSENSPRPDKRQAPRYDKELQLKFDFSYNATTELKYEVEEDRRQKYTAVSKNIGATGLCLTSPHPLKKGQHLHLEVYLPKGREPIHMDGEVCWCSSSGNAQAMFDAGIKLATVEGEAVDATVYLDEENHVLWSNVLESIFGTFRKLVQEEIRQSI